MPVQSQAGLFGFIPADPAIAPRFVGAHFFAGHHQVGHLANTFRIAADRIRVFAEEASTFLADRRQIARPSKFCTFPIVSGTESVHPIVNACATATNGWLTLVP